MKMKETQNTVALMVLIMLISLLFLPFSSTSVQAAEAQKITLGVRAGSDLEERAAMVIASKLKELGLNPKVESVDYIALVARTRRSALSGETWDQGGIDIVFFAFGGTAFEPAGVNRYFHSGSRAAFNCWNYFDALLDRELDAASSSVDIPKRKEHYVKAAARLQSEMPAVPLYHPKLVYVLRKGWTGIKANEVNAPKATASFFQMKYKGKPAKHLRFAVPEDVRSPNALFDWTNSGISLSSMVMDRLVMLDDSLQPLKPSLAESWTFTDGGKTVTFNLRRGVKWHDGQPFTSKDVKFSFETRMNKEAGAELGAGFRMVDEVLAPDDHTIVLKMRAPYAPLLFEVGLTAIAPAHVFEGVPAKELAKSPYSSGEKMIPGTGAYKLVSWDKRERIELVANPDYFRGKPTVEKITWIIVPDKSAAMASIRAGQVDVLDCMYELTKELDELKRDPNLDFFVYDALNVETMNFNCSHPLLANRYVRQAIAHAVPKKHIADRLGHGYLTVANQLLHPNNWGFSKDQPVIPFDMEKARELLYQSTKYLSPSK